MVNKLLRYQSAEIPQKLPVSSDQSITVIRPHAWPRNWVPEVAALFETGGAEMRSAVVEFLLGFLVVWYCVRMLGTGVSINTD